LERSPSREAPPVDTAHLFSGLHAHLIALLRGLGPADWSRSTVAGAWQVRDVVAHVLDGQVRRLSMHRDGHAVPPGRDLPDYEALVDHLNELNVSWVGAMRRVSTDLLIDLLDRVGSQMAAFVAELDPHATAPFPVAWAAEEVSENWFDIGRDYTELWHHQAQIRLAVDAEPLTGREWLHPVLALSVRGLRRTLGGIDRPDGTVVVLRLVGAAGGVWSAVSGSAGWRLYEGALPAPSAEVALAADQAWRVFFNAASSAEAKALTRSSGDRELTEAVLRMRSVMVRGP
jgi:hypothetical protein